MRVSLSPFPFVFTKMLMIFSSDPAACMFANKCGEVRKSVQSFKDTLLFRDLRHQFKLCCELENQEGRKNKNLTLCC